MKILVADDDSLFLKIVTEILEGAGHEVVGATSGDEALEIAASEVPDIMVLDVVLPGLLGCGCPKLKRCVISSRRCLESA